MQKRIGSTEVTLTSADLQSIAAILAQVSVQGDRYPESLKSRVGR